MVRTFEFRLFPTQGQERALEEHRETLRQFYNAALHERRQAYSRAKEQAAASGKKPKSTVSLASQEKAVKEIKALCPEYDAIHSHPYQSTLQRVDGAFQRFFARRKEGKAGGFPRFRSFQRFRSFSFKEAGNGNKLLDKDEPVQRPRGSLRQDFPALPDIDSPDFKLVAGGKRLYLHGIGKVKVKLHRPYEGQVKVVRVLRKQGHWFAQFVCDDVPPRPLKPTGKTVGIDLGLTTFAALSDENDVPNPRIAERAQPAIAKAQRRVTRRKKGSKRRRKAVVLLSRRHGRVQATRATFHHTVAKELIERYDIVSIEALNIEGLARGMLAKQVQDVGWGQFVQILVNKAERAGREVIRVEAAGTSQECSGCHAEVRKGLHVRVHRCPHCGLVVGRDTNAARNVHGRGTAIVEGREVGSPEKREAPTSA